MKVLLDIKDKKAPAILEVLRGLKYVRTIPISPEKALLIAEIKEAVENLNKVKRGEMKAKTLQELINEL